jgi:hypothetical protein
MWPVASIAGAAMWIAVAASGSVMQQNACDLRLLVTGTGLLDGSERVDAKAAVRTLLATGGLTASWCRSDDAAACAGPATRRTISVVLLPTGDPDAISSGHTARDTATGEAVVVVFVEPLRRRAIEIRRRASAQLEPLLATTSAGHLTGIAIAHEIGHALGLSHATTGIMQPRLDAADIAAFRAGRLAFSAREGERMRLRSALSMQTPREPSCCKTNDRAPDQRNRRGHQQRRRRQQRKPQQREGGALDRGAAATISTEDRPPAMACSRARMLPLPTDRRVESMPWIGREQALPRETNQRFSCSNVYTMTSG